MINRDVYASKQHVLRRMGWTTELCKCPVHKGLYGYGVKTAGDCPPAYIELSKTWWGPKLMAIVSLLHPSYTLGGTSDFVGRNR